MCIVIINILICLAKSNVTVVPSVPSAAPSSLSVTDVTVFTITVQWGKVQCTAWNGIITNYTVWYNWDTENGNSMAESSEMTDDNMESRSVCIREDSTLDEDASIADTGPEGVNRRAVNVSAIKHQVTLTGLRPLTNYHITVAAYNSVGIGQQSQPAFVKTNGEWHM